MTLYVYVDNSNVWIEGMRVSAVRRGLASSLQEAMNEKILDADWTYDFGQLYRLICPPGEQVGRSSLFGSRPPDNDSIWQAARDEGFQVFLFDRNAKNKEKKVDVGLATQMLEDSFLYMKPGDSIVLAAGDQDYLPAIESLQRRGYSTRVAFWEHATGADLKRAPIEFFPLDPWFDFVSR